MLIYCQIFERPHYLTRADKQCWIQKYWPCSKMSREVNLAVSLILNGTSFCESKSVYKVSAAYYGVFSACHPPSPSLSCSRPFLPPFLPQYASTTATVQRGLWRPYGAKRKLPQRVSSPHLDINEAGGWQTMDRSCTHNGCCMQLVSVLCQPPRHHRLDDAVW